MTTVLMRVIPHQGTNRENVLFININSPKWSEKIAEATFWRDSSVAEQWSVESQVAGPIPALSANFDDYG